MAITAQGRPVSGGVLLSWTDTNEDSYTVGVTEYNLSDPDSPSTRTVTLTSPDILSWFDEDLDPDTDTVTYLITNTNDSQTATVTVVLSGESWAEVDHLETTARYTTLAKVKATLGIPSVQTDRDTTITEAIVSAESWIDGYCGSAFPQTGAQPGIAGIPERVKRAARILSVGFYLAEFDPAVSDGFEAELRRTAAIDEAVGLLYGFRYEFGVA